MSRTAHLIYTGILTAIILGTVLALAYRGFSYYGVSLEERFFHPDHTTLKSSGLTGHTLGIAGSLFILIGVASYMVRKRYRFLSRIGQLKYWLEFHIFMCVLGSFLIVFHTAFKFAGVAGISFWSMSIVFLSGIAGRIIYLQIPRTIEGRELDLREVREMRTDITARIRNEYGLGDDTVTALARTIENKAGIKEVRALLRQNRVTLKETRSITALIREDISLGKKIERLETMKRLFTYWHVAHLPFAIIMVIFMVIHVVVTVALGYRWIF